MTLEYDMMDCPLLSTANVAYVVVLHCSSTMLVLLNFHQLVSSFQQRGWHTYTDLQHESITIQSVFILTKASILMLTFSTYFTCQLFNLQHVSMFQTEFMQSVDSNKIIYCLNTEVHCMTSSITNMFKKRPNVL